MLIVYKVIPLLNIIKNLTRDWNVIAGCAHFSEAEVI